MKWFVVYCIVGAACVFADSTEDFCILDSIYAEGPCNRAGGICTMAADCPNLAEKTGLCPKQRRKGVECCYGFSVKETRCHKHGGTCLGPGVFCGASVRYDEATDCPTGATCCILVK